MALERSLTRQVRGTAELYSKEDARDTGGGRLSAALLQSQGMEIREPREGLRLWVGLQEAMGESGAQGAFESRVWASAKSKTNDDHVVTRPGCAEQ